MLYKVSVRGKVAPSGLKVVDISCTPVVSGLYLIWVHNSQVAYGAISYLGERGDENHRMWPLDETRESVFEGQMMG
jgi:hypothetical protein